MKGKVKYLAIVVAFFGPPVFLFGQHVDALSDQIMVLARPYRDSIVIRWAPGEILDWKKGNTAGYRVERFTLVRNKKVLAPAEQVMLTLEPVLPRRLEAWQRFITTDKYAAIAAQCLFGETLDLKVSNDDIFQFVNKAKEEEQRFSIAMFSADMSATVATLSGLRFVDRNVRQGEKYLYRISTGTTELPVRGSVFTEAQDYQLPVPVDFSAEFQGNRVLLKWNKLYHRGIYTAYVVERAQSGRDFMPISSQPFVVLENDERAPSKYQFATDSIPVGASAVSYRVRGLTPFAEMGPPSEAVSGKYSVYVDGVPRIIRAHSENNRSIILEWEFPLGHEVAIEGFRIKRSDSPAGLKATEGFLVARSSRQFEDTAANQHNYYQVSAKTYDGRALASPVHYASLVDSLPPAVPKGLMGVVNSKGIVKLKWTPNADPDIYGYRVYRGNQLRDEFSQVTTGPVRQASFVDTINLNTLNRQVHYQVMAIDRNQNHSALSAAVSLGLPDIVKPAPPVMLPTRSTRSGVTLEWLPSGSEDVLRYDIYRKDRQAWIKIGSVNQTTDSLFQFVDSTSAEGGVVNFTVVAVDKSGLESEPAGPMAASKIISSIKPPVKIATPEVDRTQRKIILRWRYDVAGVERYQIYRASEGGSPSLHATVEATKNHFEDRSLAMNSNYTYRVVALFASGARSEFSDEIKVKY